MSPVRHRSFCLLVVALGWLAGCRRDEGVKAEPAPSAPGAMARPTEETPGPSAPAPTASTTASATPPPAAPAPCALAGKVSVARYGSAMVKLPDGRVLVIGGGTHDQDGAQSAVDVIDPQKLTTAPFAPLGDGRLRPSAVALPDGHVVVAHGLVQSKGATPAAEIYDPGSKTWRLIRLPGKHLVQRPLVAPLPGGKVLIAGGDLMWKGALSQDSFVLDVGSGKLTATSPLPESGAADGFYRVEKQGTVVWAAGGRSTDGNGSPTSQDCDLRFDSATNTWTDLKSCRPFENGVDRYPDASGKTSFFGLRGTREVVRYAAGKWASAFTGVDGQPGGFPIDALALDAHRLVVVDGSTGDALVCTL